MMNSREQVFDHCTVTNGRDETLSIFWDGDVGAVTVQRTLMTNSKTGMILGGRGEWGDFTVANNLFAGISHRFPNLGSKNDAQYDVINNVVYGHGARLVTIAGSNDPPGYHTNDQDVNYVNNYIKPSGWLRGLGGGSWPVDRLNIISEYLADPDLVDIYSAGNIVIGFRETPQANDDDMWTNFNWNYSGTDGAFEYTDLREGPWFTDTMWPLSGRPFAIRTAEEAYLDVTSNVGANAYLDNDHNPVAYTTPSDAMWLQRVLDDTLDRNAGYSDADASFGEHTSSVSRPAGWDTDGDGMPNTWESAHGRNPDVDESTFVWPSGYVGVEEYLNEIDGDADVCP